MKGNGWRLWLSKHVPFIGKHKRYFVAFQASVSPIRNSYSQNHEDVTLLRLLHAYKVSFSIDYVDVGANHPTDISNTYLLYRNSFTGFLVEPNQELCGLLTAFRPKDKVLNIGIGSEPQVKPFLISRTPVGSSFDEEFFYFKKQMLDRIVYVPVMTLDQAFPALRYPSIGVLSIDVEGWNLRVVETGMSVIARSKILCVEYDNPKERAGILSLVPDFELITDNGCNLIMRRFP
jgi:FkbM family methyltransferase